MWYHASDYDIWPFFVTIPDFRDNEQPATTEDLYKLYYRLYMALNDVDRRRTQKTARESVNCKQSFIYLI